MNRNLEELTQEIKQKTDRNSSPRRQVTNLRRALGLALAADEIGDIGIYIAANAGEEVEQEPGPGSRNHGKSWSFVLRESEVQVIIEGERPEEGWIAFMNRGDELATELLDQIDRT